MDINAISRIYNYTKHNGGGTFVARDQGGASPGTPVKRSSGYAVSLKGGGFLRSTAAGWADFKRLVPHVLSSTSASHIGTWEHEGITYVDPVVLVGSLEDAHKLASANGQDAFYGFAEREVIYMVKNSKETK